MRIIIADDQKHTRHGLRVLLSTFLPKTEIWEAVTGVEAERLAEEVCPELILMDIRMPDRDGLAATRNIKSRRPEIRILVVSLYAARQAEALAAGADAFVSKGEPPERLLARIRLLLTDGPELLP
jgi:DNA-binding NarL/FixJ family response regulator